MSKKFEWTTQALALLGTDTDAAIAQKLDVHPKTVFKKRKNTGIHKHDSYRALPVGSVPDTAIAAMKGVSAVSVAMQRKRKGIAAYQKQTKWTEEDVALLGTAKDKEVAGLVGRERMAVYAARRSRGIAAYPGEPSAAVMDKQRLALKAIAAGNTVPDAMVELAKQALAVTPEN